MATIKSYTDLSQSKKLAEILPIESADMKWYFWKSEIDAPKLPTFGYSKTAAESYKDTEAVYIPCWSLGALLEVLPMPTLEQDKAEDELFWQCSVYNEEGEKLCETYSSDKVDVCYEMVVKLDKLNLL